MTARILCLSVILTMCPSFYCALRRSCARHLESLVGRNATTWIPMRVPPLGGAVMRILSPDGPRGSLIDAGRQVSLSDTS